MLLPYLLEKEFKQMMRNIILPVVFIVLPLGLINVMARAATQEVKNLRVAVVDNDHSSLSRRFVQKLFASDSFVPADCPGAYAEALADVEAGRADFIVEIAPRFERRLVVEGTASVMISANAVNGVKASLGTSYLSQIVADFAAQLRSERGLSAEGVAIQAGRVTVEPRYLFNTHLDYKVFMVPGLIAMLLVLTVGFLPALNIVGEKEKGTIEQINVTPIGRGTFILSKLIPYWCAGLVIMAYAMVLAWKLYDLVPAGSLATLFLFVTLFILVISSLGLIVSNYSDTTQQAALVMFFFLVIFLLMSGLLTPVSAMPEWAQRITLFNPLRYFIEVMRALYLKGSTLADLRPQLYALGGFAVVLWSWAILSYRKNE